MPLDSASPSRRSHRCTCRRCSQPLAVSCCPHPFEQRRVDYAVPAGLTIAEIVELIQPDPLLRMHGVAFLGEQAVERQHWHRVRPKPGTYLSIRLLPAGGGGWRIAAMVGIAIIAVVTTALTYGALAPVWGTTAAAIAGGLAGAAVTLGGTLLVNTFLPPPVPELSKDKGTESQTYQILGARNRVDIWGKVPFLCGRFRLTPPYAAVPYREVVGSDTYWRAIFAVSHGPVHVETMRIGETPIGNYAEVEWQMRRGYWTMPDKGGWDPAAGVFPANPELRRYLDGDLVRYGQRACDRRRPDHHLQPSRRCQQRIGLGSRSGQAVLALSVGRLRGPAVGGADLCRRRPGADDGAGSRRDRDRDRLRAAGAHPEPAGRQEVGPVGCPQDRAVAGRREPLEHGAGAHRHRPAADAALLGASLAAGRVRRRRCQPELRRADHPAQRRHRRGAELLQVLLDGAAHDQLGRSGASPRRHADRGAHPRHRAAAGDDRRVQRHRADHRPRLGRQHQQLGLAADVVAGGAVPAHPAAPEPTEARDRRADRPGAAGVLGRGDAAGPARVQRRVRRQDLALRRADPRRPPRPGDGQLARPEVLGGHRRAAACRCGCSRRATAGTTRAR